MKMTLSVIVAFAIVVLWFIYGSPLGSGKAKEPNACGERLCLVEIVRTCEQSQAPERAVISFVARPAGEQAEAVPYNIRTDVADKVPFVSMGRNVSIATGIVQRGGERRESIRTDSSTDLEITVSTLGPDEEIASFTLSADATCDK